MPQRNEVANVQQVLAQLAIVRNTSTAAITAATTVNANALFGRT